MKEVDPHCSVLMARRVEDLLPTAAAFYVGLDPEMREKGRPGKAGVWNGAGEVNPALNSEVVIPLWAMQAATEVADGLIQVGARLKNPGMWGPGGLTPRPVRAAYEAGFHELTAFGVDETSSGELMRSAAHNVLLRLARSTMDEAVLPITGRNGLRVVRGTLYGEGVMEAAVRSGADVRRIFEEIEGWCGLEVVHLPRNGLLLKVPEQKSVSAVMKGFNDELTFEEDEEEELETWLRERCGVPEE